jgi:ketosteroid isomerase-like protein
MRSPYLWSEPMLRSRLKRPLCLAPLILSVLLLCGIAHAAPASSAAADQAAIRKVLDAQVEAWNRGDITSFMQGYDNAPTTTFIGKSVAHGYADVLARYQKSFGSKEKMGTLKFTDLEVTRLDPQIITATGRYHLARSSSGGGDASGIFSLVFKKTPAGWKIVLDHTS